MKTNLYTYSNLCITSKLYTIYNNKTSLSEINFEIDEFFFYNNLLNDASFEEIDCIHEIIRIRRKEIVHATQQPCLQVGDRSITILPF